jgi:hypothetical protein
LEICWIVAILDRLNVLEMLQRTLAQTQHHVSEVIAFVGFVSGVNSTSQQPTLTAVRTAFGNTLVERRIRFARQKDRVQLGHLLSSFLESHQLQVDSVVKIAWIGLVVGIAVDADRGYVLIDIITVISVRDEMSPNPCLRIVAIHHASLATEAVGQIQIPQPEVPDIISVNARHRVFFCCKIFRDFEFYQVIAVVRPVLSRLCRN